MKYRSLRGMEDILPAEIKKWHRLEELARKNLESHGYSEIRTPILEETALFERSIGEGTDIVTKEMFTFADRKERSLTMRPEGTASVVRAFIEHALDQNQRESKLYYIGPMFRSERPQKGRLRQFHQIGTEIIGAYSPYADVEAIAQLDSMIRDFGVNEYVIKLNSLGCRNDKAAFAEVLKKYLVEKKAGLCEDCKMRIEKNVLRVLDCKNESCRAILTTAPLVMSVQCDDCKKHFATVKSALTSLNVRFEESMHLVRGLDYYTRTVFEVTSTGLGSQDAIGAGGRYDNLVKELGGPDLGAVGYAVGMERILLSLGDISYGKKAVIYVATLGDRAKIEGLKLASVLRGSVDVEVVSDIKGASLKAQFRTADSLGAKFVVIIGENELDKGVFVLRNMETKEQVELKKDDLMLRLRTV